MVVDLERVDEGRFWKQKYAYEKKWRDPDDVYIEVEQREQERKQQGLPPRIGIVPYSALADEEKRIEEEQEQKNSAAASARGPLETPGGQSGGRAMTKKHEPTKPKIVWVGSTPITRIAAKERRKIRKDIQKRQERLRRRCPEVHSKVVEDVSHSTEDGTLYFSVRFKDKTDFSLRFACEMFIVGADLTDMQTGDLEMIREYMKPIRR